MKILDKLFGNAVSMVEKREVEIEEGIKKSDTHYKYYFKVKEYTVTMTLKYDKRYKENDKGIKEENKHHPWRKTWSCPCKHSSLFGEKENIPCPHILAVIIHLGIGYLTNKKYSKELLTREDKLEFTGVNLS